MGDGKKRAKSKPLKTKAELLAYRRGYNKAVGRAVLAESANRQLRSMPHPSPPPGRTLHVEAGGLKLSWTFPRVRAGVVIGAVELRVTGPDLSPDQYDACEKFIGAAIRAFRQNWPRQEPEYAI